MADYDLTTRTKVREFVQKGTAETGQDTIIDDLISRASKAIMAWAGREFAPATAAAARSFAYTGGGFLSLAPYDLRSASQIQFDTDTASPSTLVSTDYALRPLNNPSATYQFLRVPSFTVTDKPGKIATERQVTVTGAWGFASVPPDVAHACILTVADWLRRDVAAFSRGFNVEAGQFEFPGAFPDAARAVLRLYRAVPVG